MKEQPIGPGWFVAIVGPSGSGKDTILRGAQAELSDDDGIVFPRRAITRPDGDDNEDHIAFTEQEFIDAESGGAFCISWRAHGLSYGIPMTVCDAVREGKIVVANLSRTALPDMHRIFARTHTVSIRVSPQIARARLLERGRETEDEIIARLDRMQRYTLTDPEALEIDNSGPRATAIQSLVNQLNGIKNKVERIETRQADRA